MRAEPIDILDTLSAQGLIRDYLRKSQPVVVRNWAAAWPAMRWTLDDLAKNYPEHKFDCEVYKPNTSKSVESWEDESRQREMGFEEFLALVRDPNGPVPKPYLAECPLANSIPELLQGFVDISEYMDLPKIMPSRMRELCQLPPNFWVGPADTVSPLHFDLVHNIFVQFSGRKRWTMIAPSNDRAVYHPHASIADDLFHWSPVNPEEPNYERFPRFRDVRQAVFEVDPGDMVFVPPGWWHQVRSLTESISVNFFWYLPLRTSFALRRYAYRYARRRSLNALRLDGVRRFAEEGA